MFGHSKIPDLDRERAMGLRWTFMPVNWREMERSGPVNLSNSVPPEWRALDAFVIAAKQRGLNILMQAPVMGGNAGGPPEWAGRRKAGRSAPADMQAAAAFAAKLAARYCPGGTLARHEGWGTKFGVRVWELDNEPESYRTHWKEQARDYAEFVTEVAAEIKRTDPQALIVSPGVAGGGSGMAWVEQALRSDPGGEFSIGPSTDVVSFHCYEGLETAFSGEDRTIERDFLDIRKVFEQGEQRSNGAPYTRKEDYWHTEGNFDFLGILSEQRRAAWRFQFFTRAFAAGIRKVCVMDASPAERRSVRAYVEALPDPFPMLLATGQVNVVTGHVAAFMHPDPAVPGSSPAIADQGAKPVAGRVWVLWALANTGDAVVEVPTLYPHVTCVGVDGRTKVCPASDGKVRLNLKGDPKMAAGILLLDRAIQ
jgi:hypothetical protein